MDPKTFATKLAAALEDLFTYEHRPANLIAKHSRRHHPVPHAVPPQQSNPS